MAFQSSYEESAPIISLNFLILILLKFQWQNCLIFNNSHAQGLNSKHLQNLLDEFQLINNFPITPTAC